jgi:hypothetical protein
MAPCRSRWRVFWSFQVKRKPTMTKIFPWKITNILNFFIISQRWIRAILMETWKYIKMAPNRSWYRVFCHIEVSKKKENQHRRKFSPDICISQRRWIHAIIMETWKCILKGALSKSKQGIFVFWSFQEKKNQHGFIHVIFHGYFFFFFFFWHGSTIKQMTPCLSGYWVFLSFIVSKKKENYPKRKYSRES